MPTVDRVLSIYSVSEDVMDFKPAEPSTRFRDFSDLYRAAFAERDPDLKGRLLREVQKAIDDREQSYQLLPSAAA